MANNAQDCHLPLPGLPGEPLTGLGGYKTSLALGLLGAGAAGVFIYAHWTMMAAGAVVVLILSAMESEAFLLFIFLLIPFVWVLKEDTPVRNVSLVLRSLVVVGFFAGRLWRGRVRIGHLFRPMVSRASLLFLCAAVVPTVLAKGELTHEAGRADFDLATFVGFYFVVLAWVDSRRRMRKVLWALLFSAVVTAVFAFYQQIVGGYSSLWLYLNPQNENTPPWSGRSTSFMGHPNSLAFYLNLVLPFALACYVLGQGWWKKLGGWTLGLGFLALVSTQSVGGMLGFTSILVLAIFCFVRSRKKRFVLLAGICALFCLFYLLGPILNPAHTQEMFESDAVSRLLFWSEAGNEFIHSPVFGVGWGNFAIPLNVPMLTGVGEPHNIYLQLLAETGLVGFVAFLYFVVQCCRQARRQLRSSHDFLDLALAFGVLGALLSLLVHGSIDIPFFVQSGTLLWVLLALLVSSGRLQRKSVVGRVRVSEAPA